MHKGAKNHGQVRVRLSAATRDGPNFMSADNQNNNNNNTDSAALQQSLSSSSNSDNGYRFGDLTRRFLGNRVQQLTGKDEYEFGAKSIVKKSHFTLSCFLQNVRKIECKENTWQVV